MKITAVILAGLAAATATPVTTLEQRQAAQTTSNELKEGPCKPVTFIMARGSTETGNMVRRHRPPSLLPTKSPRILTVIP